MDAFNNTTQSGNIQNDEDNMLSVGLRVGAYCIILVMSLFGNILVILTYNVDYNDLRRLAIGTTICQMAVADLVSSITGIPSMITMLLSSRRWLVRGVFGIAVCKLHNYALEVGVCVSALSIAIISIERFLSVFYPLRQLITTKVAKIIAILSWFGACCFYAPKLHTTKVLAIGPNMYCASFDFESWRKTEAIFHGLLFMVTLVLYIVIIVKVTRKKSIQGRVVSTNGELARSRLNRRVIRQALCVITVHYLCWMPYLFTYNVCVVLKLKLKYVCQDMGIFHDFFIFFLGFSNAALNPLIYTATNENFRKGCLNVLRRMCCMVRISPVIAIKTSKETDVQHKQQRARRKQQPFDVPMASDQQLVHMEQSNTRQITLNTPRYKANNDSPRHILVVPRRNQDENYI